MTTEHNARRYVRKTCTDGPGGTPCIVCRDAYRDQERAYALDRRARLLADPTIRPHGDPNTYSNWGCRCVPCTEVWSAYQARIRLARGETRGGRPGGQRRNKPFGREWIDQ